LLANPSFFRRKLKDVLWQLGGIDLEEHWRRSLAKAITYRLLIIVLDITVIYLFTGRLDIAFGFMMVSNVYTSIAYYFHERIWNRIDWGKKK
jgi:adenylylsulfate kinase